MITDDLPTTSTPGDVLAAVDALGPAIAARAEEIEGARRVPTDLLDSLVAAGAFRMLLPADLGGLGFSVPDAVLVLEALAAADASVAWIVMIGGGAWCDLATLPRETLEALFATRDDVIVAGVFNPTGSITAESGGYRVRGRWAFASGCEHATWLYANAVESMGDGEHQLRGAVFSPHEVEIEDTWRAVGLRGTGSHHFHADVVVPRERTFRPMADEPALDEPILRLPVPALLSILVASVAVGVARGALDDITSLATEKVPLLADAPLATNPLFQHDLAVADTDLRAARALLRATAADAWSSARAGAELAPEQRARIRATAVWVTDRAIGVVETAYRAGGSTAVSDHSPLQRRVRDSLAIGAHFLVKRDTFTTAGALLAGQPLTVPIF
jgi:alkylation response protein AidB-like acyl-CoA dehydrogenase